MKAIFLDRDGTINKGKYFITDVADLKIYKNAPRALRLLQKGGYKLISFTNQSCVARGIITEDYLKKINQRLIDIYRKRGVRISRIYYCPHHPKGKIKKYTKICSCRKPKPGMLIKAKRQYKINTKKSFAIGDAFRDLEAGKKVGCKTILLLTGYGKITLSKLKKRQRKKIDYIASSLLSASRWILRQK